MPIDLDDLERVAKDPALQLGCGPLVTLALIARIRRLEEELSRASGIARAHGATAYADDFMRVAQDREDFDAEVTEGSGKPR
jgi:hypothetical protein